jgi:hypothetical protein
MKFNPRRKALPVVVVVLDATQMGTKIPGVNVPNVIRYVKKYPTSTCFTRFKVASKIHARNETNSVPTAMDARCWNRSDSHVVVS